MLIPMGFHPKGTENPADEEDRQRVAVDIRTGGSYVVRF